MVKTYLIDYFPETIIDKRQPPSPQAFQLALTNEQLEGLWTMANIVDPTASHFLMWQQQRARGRWIPISDEDYGVFPTFLGQLYEPFDPARNYLQNFYELNAVVEPDKRPLKRYWYVVEGVSDRDGGPALFFLQSRDLEYLQGMLTLLGWQGKNQADYIKVVYDRSVPMQIGG